MHYVVNHESHALVFIINNTHLNTSISVYVRVIFCFLAIFIWLWLLGPVFRCTLQIEVFRIETIFLFHISNFRRRHHTLVFYVIFMEINFHCRPYSCEANFKIGPSKCERKCFSLIEMLPLPVQNPETSDIVHTFLWFFIIIFIDARKKKLQLRPCSNKGTHWVASSTFP